jgi:hypothetical protein
MVVFVVTANILSLLSFTDMDCEMNKYQTKLYIYRPGQAQRVPGG